MKPTKEKSREMHKSRHSGFSMIEVLVAVLILAVGLLGVAGVQVVSMQNTSNANLRTLATIYAQDMAERIRANGNTVLPDAAREAWEDRMQVELGPLATGTVVPNGDVIDIQLQWVERDPAVTEDGEEGDGAPGRGRSLQTFNYRIEV